MLSEIHFQQLVNEVGILQLINHRNKNQHRLLTWWKYFRLLLSHLKKIILLQDSESSNQQIVINKLFQKLIISKCYYEFNGIIALGQFLLLGLTLISSLSKVHEILQSYRIQKSGYKTENITLVDEELGEEIELPQTTEKSVDVLDQPNITRSISPEPELDSHTHSKPKSKSSKKRKNEDKEGKKKKKKKKTDIDLLFD